MGTTLYSAEFTPSRALVCPPSLPALLGRENDVHTISHKLDIALQIPVSHTGHFREGTERHPGAIDDQRKKKVYVQYLLPNYSSSSLSRCQKPPRTTRNLDLLQIAFGLLRRVAPLRVPAPQLRPLLKEAQAPKLRAWRAQRRVDEHSVVEDLHVMLGRLEALRQQELQHRQGRCKEEAVGQRGVRGPLDDGGHGIFEAADAETVLVRFDVVEAGGAVALYALAREG